MLVKIVDQASHANYQLETIRERKNRFGATCKRLI